jgi:uncharacterized membrane protein
VPTASRLAVIGAVLAVAGVNVALKSPQLDRQSLWLDEAITVFYAQQSPHTVMQYAAHNQNPPLHGLVMWAWLGVFGTSEAAARSFSVLCSTATAVALMLLACRFLGRRSALLVVVLFTLSNIHLQYAREARGYALVSLLCVVSAGAYLTLVTQPRWRTACLLGVVNALLVYTHYVTAFVWLVQLLATVLHHEWRVRAGRHVLVAMLIGAALIAPWMPFALRNVPRTGAYWLGAPTWADLVDVLKRYAGRRWHLYAPLVLLLGPLRRRIGIAPQAWHPGITVYLALWAFLPIALAFGIATHVPIFLDRYLLYSSLGLLLLIAYVLAALPMGRNGTVAVAIAIAALLFPKALRASLKDDWRGLAALVHAHHDARPAGTSLVLIAPAELIPFAYYYDPRVFAAAELVEPLRAAGILAVADVSAVDPARVATAETIAVVRTRDTEPAVTPLTRDRGFTALRPLAALHGLQLLVTERTPRADVADRDD